LRLYGKSESIWTTLSEALSTVYEAGLDIHWGEYHWDFDEFHKVVSMPAYQWDYKNHWIQNVHNWCLTKGDATSAIAGPTASPAASPKFLSATCQKVVHSSVLIESDISYSDLRAVFEAHIVNGSILCPASVYADVAMTLGNYLNDDNPVKANRGVEVANMATTKPLIMRTPGKSEPFRASADAD
jgi:naphtho-gamma-pyrone polyketide synthase